MSTKPAGRWFADRGWAPLPFQREVWHHYLAGQSGLIHSATGTGKTLAAWWGPLLEWLDEHGARAPREAAGVAKKVRRSAAPPLRVLWITPLRALAADTLQSLESPLRDLGLPWTLESRTGDTAPGQRARQGRRLPTALVTTPESLTLLLTPDVVEAFSDLRAVVVDEWHELMGTKRGVQTELALARLRTLAPAARTWGLSATIGNLDDARNALLGMTGSARGCIVRGDEPKSVVVDALIPPVIERFPWAGHLGTQLAPQVAAAVVRVGAGSRDAL